MVNKLPFDLLGLLRISEFQTEKSGLAVARLRCGLL